MSQQFNAPGMTKWTNPPNKPTAKLKLYKHPPVIVPHKVDGMPGTLKDSGFLEVEIAPGASCWLESKFDDAIQKKGADGIVQSGECPWLIKDDVTPELHESLDPIEQQRLQAEKDAEAARQKAIQAEADLARADALRADAERLQRENDARAKADQEARDKLAAERAEVAKLKEELERLKAEQEKKLEELAKPAAPAPAPDATGSGGGESAQGSTGKRGGKAST